MDSATPQWGREGVPAVSGCGPACTTVWALLKAPSVLLATALLVTLSQWGGSGLGCQVSWCLRVCWGWDFWAVTERCLQCPGSLPHSVLGQLHLGEALLVQGRSRAQHPRSTHSAGWLQGAAPTVAIPDWPVGPWGAADCTTPLWRVLRGFASSSSSGFSLWLCRIQLRPCWSLHRGALCSCVCFSALNSLRVQRVPF